MNWRNIFGTEDPREARTQGTLDCELKAFPAGTNGAVTLRVFDRSAAKCDPVAVNEVHVQL